MEADRNCNPIYTHAVKWFKDDIEFIINWE